MTMNDECEPSAFGGPVNPVAQRFGITVPFDGVPLPAHRELFGELVDLGYTDVWSAEVDGADGFTPLALAAAWTPSLNVGTAIAPAYTRGPALLAQTVASLADAAPGRFFFGLGASSDVIVERWNGIPYVDPYRRTRDTLRFLRAAISGDRVDFAGDHFSVQGFRLSRPPEQIPPIYLAALRPGMLHLAGREADGAILNWLSGEDVEKAIAEVGAGKEIVARIFVCPSEDAEVARAIGRRMIATYLNVQGYAQFHRWLGRGPVLEPMWTAWNSGDRRGALDAIPDSLVDELFVHGSFDACRAHIARYVEHGVTVPVPALVLADVDLQTALRGLAPRR
jgi:probable F420-dependent oxidoreductase